MVSFETPEYTANADAIGTLRLLECIRQLKPGRDVAFLPSLDVGNIRHGPSDAANGKIQPFYPRSPYGVAKLYAYWITVNYREAYGIYASNGILFNHESPIRGETFVTRKISRAVAAIHLGLQENLYLMERQSGWDGALPRQKCSPTLSCCLI